MFGIGVPELILILVVGLVVFGPGKLPEVARSLGKGIREFRKAPHAACPAQRRKKAERKPSRSGMAFFMPSIRISYTGSGKFR